jgi:hypothetical protein
MVRLVWRKGAIYRFFWRHCEGFLSEEKMDMAFRLEFCFFVSRQRKIKNKFYFFVEEQFNFTSLCKKKFYY